MAIAPHCIRIEEIGHAEASDSQLHPVHGQLGEGRKRPAIAFGLLPAQRKHLVIHHTAEVRRVAQCCIAHSIQIGETRHSQRTAQPKPRRCLEVQQHLR